MMVSNTNRSFALFGLIVGFFLAGVRSTPAQVFADGESLRLQYLFPDAGGVFDSRDLVVSGLVEAPGFPAGDPRTNIDFLLNSIDVTYTSGATWSGAAFNGFRVFDFNGTTLPFASVVIDPETNFPGLDASRITFDADNIFVNWQGLDFDTTTTLFLTVNAEAPVVAPAASPAAPVVVIEEIRVTDFGAIQSIRFSALPVAILQRQTLLGITRAATRDVNGRLFRLRLGGETAGAPGPTGLSRAAGKDMKEFQEVAPVEAFRRFELFAAGDFGFGDTDDVGRRAGFDSQTQVATVGAEYRLTQQITLGVGLSYVSNDTFYNRNLGESDIEGFAISPYASWAGNNFYADLLYSYGNYEDEMERNNLFGGTARAHPDSTSHKAELNLGYIFKAGALTTGPILFASYVHGELDGYTERGARATNVRVGEQDWDSLVSRVGWQASYRLGDDRARFTPQVRASWEHEYLGESDRVSASLVQSPFVVVNGGGADRVGGYSASDRTPVYGRDYLALGGGVLMEFGERFSILLDYEAHLLRRDSLDQFASVRASVTF